MARSLADGLGQEITHERLAPIVLMKAEFDSGDVRLWSGLGILTWNSEAYEGAGDLLNISPIEETQSFQAVGAVFTLSGIPSWIVDLAMAEDYQERPVTLWLGTLSDQGALVGSPVLLYKGRMDVMETEEDGETATIRLASESRARSVQDKNERRWTPEDQHIDFPNDKGFDQVAALQDTEIVFGPEAEPAAASGPRNIAPRDALSRAVARRGRISANNIAPRGAESRFARAARGGSGSPRR